MFFEPGLGFLQGEAETSSQAEGRWRNVNASLNAVRRAGGFVGRPARYDSDVTEHSAGEQNPNPVIAPCRSIKR